jgi:hypothetical protein
MIGRSTVGMKVLAGAAANGRHGRQMPLFARLSDRSLWWIEQIGYSKTTYTSEGGSA